MRILSLTSIRSDYDLMSRLYIELSKNNSFEFGIVVAGVHQSEFHNFSRSKIVQDDLSIVADVFNFEGDDGFIDQVKSAANLLAVLGDAIEKFSPDVVFVVGDREDALMMSIAASYLRIPTVHFYGGDHASDGHIDNSVRQAISKLSTFHFVSTETHRDRLISMGEEVNRIKVVGSIAIDNLVEVKSMERSTILQKLFGGQIAENDRIAFFLYHPIVDEIQDFKNMFNKLIEFLTHNNIHIVIGKSNNDPMYQELNKIINKFEGHSKIHFIESLERADYVNLLRNIEIMIGNSSAGLLEMATFRVPVVNIGRRQRGRHADRNVIFSDLTYAEIEKAITKALSSKFKESLSDLQNSYGRGESVERALQELQRIDFSEALEKKFDPLKSSIFDQPGDQFESK